MKGFRDFAIYFALVLLSWAGNSVCLDQNETALVQEMRAQVDSRVPYASNSILGTDDSFLRYLKQSKNQLSTAVSKIQKTAAWRVANRVDDLAADDISVLKDSLPYEITGEAKNGNPVFYIPLGKWQLRKVQRNRQNARLQSYIIQIFEKSLRSVSNGADKRTQDDPKAAIFIIDMQGLTLRQALSGYGRTLTTFIRSANIYENHYPNTIQKWYIIRAPRNFRNLWFVARRFVSRDVAKTVEVYSRYSLRWRNALRNSIPSNALPTTLRM